MFRHCLYQQKFSPSLCLKHSRQKSIYLIGRGRSLEVSYHISWITSRPRIETALIRSRSYFLRVKNRSRAYFLRVKNRNCPQIETALIRSRSYFVRVKNRNFPRIEAAKNDRAYSIFRNWSRLKWLVVVVYKYYNSSSHNSNSKTSIFKPIFSELCSVSISDQIKGNNPSDKIIWNHLSEIRAASHFWSFKYKLRLVIDEIRYVFLVKF